MSLTYLPTASSTGLSREMRSIRTRELLAKLSDPQCSRRELEDEVIRINLAIAMQEARRYEGRGIDVEDLHQVAAMALVKAVRSYDPDKGTDLLSFAVPSIRGELRRWFRDKGWMVRPPRSIQELRAEVTAAQEHLAQELGRTARPSEVAHHLSIGVDEVIEATLASRCFAVDSLDATASADSAPRELVHREPGYARVEARVMLGPLVRELSARERRILELRFVHGASQAEIGQELGVTQTQVSRLLSSIVARLRERILGLDPAA